MIRFCGLVYRILPKGADPLARVSSPEGRFHHAGQGAIYTSLSPEGTIVAIRRYVAPGDPARWIVPLHVDAERIADLRGRPEASLVWQDLRAQGQPAPTWALSDLARQTDAQGLICSSRSRPDLGHLVLFEPFDALLGQAGDALDAEGWLTLR